MEKLLFIKIKKYTINLILTMLIDRGVDRSTSIVYLSKENVLTVNTMFVRKKIR